jgi:hypothetical protein
MEMEMEMEWVQQNSLHVRAHAIVIGYLGGWQMDRHMH